MREFLLTLILGLMTILCFGQDEALKNNKLYLKGVIKSRTPIYSSPSKSSSQVMTLEQFQFVFLYQPPGSSGKTQSGFYRVGLGPTNSSGWIPVENIQEWDSRICLHFTALVGRQPALVWNDQDIEGVIRGAIQPWDSNGGAPHTNAIAQEPGDLSDKRYNMLLPVLGEKRVTSGGKVQKAYKVGFLSGGQQQGNAPSPVQQVQRGPAALLELMFLMDATASMQPYIDGAKKVVETVARRVRESRESGVQVGLMCYRDYIQNQSSMEFITTKVHPLTSNIENVVRAMSNIQEAPVGSEDYPEAGFDGLYGAATETEWNDSKSSLRVIVFIGDASAHPAGDDKNPLNYSLNQIINVCSRNRVRVVGIKIVNDGSPSDNQLHREQMQKMTQGKTQADKGYYREIQLGSGQTQSYIDQLAAGIEQEISRMSILERASTGGTQALNNTNLTPTEKAIILKNLKVTAGTAPTSFSEGWVREFSENGAAFVNPYVYMSKDDLDLTLSYLNVTLQGIADPKKVILNTIREVLETETGDKLEANQKLVEHYEKRFGLPATSNILKFTLEEIEGWGEPRRVRLKEQIESKSKLLKNHKDDTSKWFKIPGTQFQYTFVPLSFFP